MQSLFQYCAEQIYILHYGLLSDIIIRQICKYYFSVLFGACTHKVFGGGARRELYYICKRI